jgi:uncharacterized lipoprotein YbaY
MKNLVKLFALVLVGISLFSCTTDEYDAGLEESVKVTENIRNQQSKEGDVTETQNITTTEDGDPVVIIIKKD